MESVQQTRKICGPHGSPSRCSSGKKRKKKKRTPRKHPNDFLRQEFRPVTTLIIPPRAEINQIETCFAGSISHLSKLYGFNPNLKVTTKYPFSITELYNQALEEMQKRSANVALIILQEKDEYPVIATVKEFDIEWNLYFIPLDALWLLHLKRKKDTFRLLVSVYAYLHHIAGMPLLNGHSYIQGTYDMMQQHYQDNEGEFEQDEIQETMRTFTAIGRIAPILNKEITNATNLYDLPSRIEQFKPANSFDRNLHSIACKIHQLWKDFPNESYLSNITPAFLYPDEEEIAYSEQFFSFCWCFDGWLMDQLLEWVNSDLQEKSVFELQISIQKFDREQTEILHGFSYQKQLLALLNELADLLNELYE